jgi:hypothetical protein
MKLNKSKAKIKGVFGDGDEPSLEQKIISKLGVTAEDISKIQSGELDLDSYTQTYFSNYESNLKSRLTPELQQNAMSEAFGKAYGKAEKTILDTFGLDSNKYAEIDKKERFSTIVSDIKKLQEERINGFESADAQKLAQLTQQLEQANSLVRQKEQDAAAQLDALRSEYTQKENAAIVSKRENDLINGFENSRLGAKEMRFMIRGYMNENGYNTEIDTDGNIWIVRNGTRVPNPNRHTENLKLESMFEIVAKEFQFAKQSNGAERPAGAIKLEGNPNIDKLPPQYLKYMQENGLM